jgi:hypothetical protein
VSNERVHERRESQFIGEREDIFIDALEFLRDAVNLQALSPGEQAWKLLWRTRITQVTLRGGCGFPGDSNFAACRPHLTDYAMQERALPHTVGPKETKPFTARNLQAHASKNLMIAEPSMHVINLKHVHDWLRGINA